MVALQPRLVADVFTGRESGHLVAGHDLGRADRLPPGEGARAARRSGGGEEVGGALIEFGRAP